MAPTMKPLNQVRLRNKFVRTINNWPQLGAYSWYGATPTTRLSGGDENRVGIGQKDKHILWRLVGGVARDGRLILIYPLVKYRDEVPFTISQLMMEAESRGAIVGTACNIGDVYTIVADNPTEYKRCQRTYSYRNWFGRQSKEKKNGSRANDESE